LEHSRVRRIFCNGAQSYKIYCTYQLPRTGIEAVKLPSTSPANAACSLEKLIEAWRIIRK
ncbi:MAG: DNA-deoxyinosine glycosylase, partial [Firmicutes bacterium]|nr:DNA-deoxyinosine glycosylase [Bacillota bacterium]